MSQLTDGNRSQQQYCRNTAGRVREVLDFLRQERTAEDAALGLLDTGAGQRAEATTLQTFRDAA